MVLPRGHNRVLLFMQSTSGAGWNSGSLVVERQIQNPVSARSLLTVLLETVTAPVNARGWSKLYQIDPEGCQIQVKFGGGFTPADMVVLATSWAEGL